MLPQRQLIVYRLRMNDDRWKSIKRVHDRFETISINDWEFMCRWLRERKKLIENLNVYGTIYFDIVLDS